MEERREKGKVENCGVAWKRTFKNGKEGIKISINREIYIAFVNTKKRGEKDPDFIVVHFIDEVKPNETSK
jgi:uncharacterized protein (DUF736 family)